MNMVCNALMVVTARLVLIFAVRSMASSTIGEGNPALAEENMRHRKGDF